MTSRVMTEVSRLKKNPLYDGFFLSVALLGGGQEKQRLCQRVTVGPHEKILLKSQMVPT
jgi:hypothetical protein